MDVDFLLCSPEQGGGLFNDLIHVVGFDLIPSPLGKPQQLFGQIGPDLHLLLNPLHPFIVRMRGFKIEQR